MPDEIESFMDFERARRRAFDRAQWEQGFYVSAILAVGFLLGLMAH